MKPHNARDKKAKAVESVTIDATAVMQYSKRHRYHICHVHSHDARDAPRSRFFLKGAMTADHADPPRNSSRTEAHASSLGFARKHLY